MKTLLTAALVTASLALFSAPAAAGAMTAAEFTASHSGKCIAYDGPTKGTQCYNADGSASYDDKRWGKDTGKWEIRGDEVCVNWAGEPGWISTGVTKTGDNAYTDGEYTWIVQ